MARERFDNLDPEVQQRVLAAARAEFAQSGFTGASYNRIIRQSGLSKGAIYYYFEDKADLFITVVERAMISFGHAIGGMAEGRWPARDFWGEARRVVMEAMVHAAANPEDLALFKALLGAASDPSLSARIPALWSKYREYLVGALEHGRELGEVRDDLPVSLLGDVLFAMGEATDRWSMTLLERQPRMDLAELAGLTDDVMDLFKRVAHPDARLVQWGGAPRCCETPPP